MKRKLIEAYLAVLSPIIDLFKWEEMRGFKYRVWMALMTRAYSWGDKIRGPKE